MAKDPSYIKSIDDLLKGIENGEYAIPNFQRKFEWTPGMVSDLLISIFQDYYTGLLLFWELPEHLAIGEWDPLWGADKPENPYYAILDGQQRLSSLYYAIYGPNKKFPYKKTYFMYFLDINEYLEGNFDQVFNSKFSRYFTTLDEIRNNKKEWIRSNLFPLRLLSDKEFLNKEFDAWAKEYANKRVKMSPENMDDFIKVYDEIRNIRNILDYKFITHTLGKDRDLSDICGIFAKINQSGMRLSTFDLMNAFLFPKGVKLRNIWEKTDKNNLKEVDRGMNEYILKLISLHLQDYCSSKYIFYLIPEHKIKKRNEIGKITLVNNKEEFESLWTESYNYASKVVERITNIGKNDFGAIKSDFIQNKTIIPVMGAIMWKYDHEYRNKIDQKQFDDLISKWYWFATISGDYSGSSDSIMSEDYRDFKKWFITQNDSVIRRFGKLNVDDINKLDLRSVNKGNSTYTAIICQLALNRAKDFYSTRDPGSCSYKDGKIHDHHIFPKNVRKLDDSTSKEFKNTNDSILNRTLLFDETNEKIRNKKPSEYLKEITLDEEELIELMDTHFISKKAYEFLKSDNYDDFISEREKTIKSKLLEILKIDKDVEEMEMNLDAYGGPDLSKQKSWTDDELVAYLDDCTTLQALFLSAIIHSDEYHLTINETINLMNEIASKKFNGDLKEVTGLTIAGLTSGFTHKTGNLGKENFIEAWEDKGIIYYKIKDDYFTIIEEWIKNEGL